MGTSSPTAWKPETVIWHVFDVIYTSGAPMWRSPSGGLGRGKPTSVFLPARAPFQMHFLVIRLSHGLIFKMGEVVNIVKYNLPVT